MTFELLPSETGLFGYSETLKGYNAFMHKRLKTLLSGAMLEDEDNFSIVTTGSDGRFEKNPDSKVELIVLGNQSTNFERIKVALDDVLAKTDRLFDPEIEYRRPSFEVVSYFNNNPARIFPSRAIDSLHLIGNESLSHAYKLKLVGELTDSSTSSRIRKKLKANRVYSKKILETGIADTTAVVNYLTGELISDNTVYKATKNGLLRSTQYRIIQDVASKIHTKQFSVDDLDSFPQDTASRLNYLFYNGYLSLTKQSIDTVCAAYNTALYWYHLVEESRAKTSCASIFVPVSDLHCVKQILSEFSSKPIMK